MIQPITSPTIQQKITNILLGFCFIIVWEVGMAFILAAVWNGHFSIFKLDNPYFPSVWWGYFTALIYAPIVEEAVFRYPLKHVKPDHQILYILISSAFFGYLHGGSLNFVFQGVSGVVFCWLYIRNNYSYWSAVILHFMLNLFAINV